MELKQIKELMAAMEKADLKRLRIKDKNGYELELERKEDVHPAQEPPIFHPHPSVDQHRVLPLHTPKGPIPQESSKVEEGKFIKSPMVGTLYMAPSPDDPPFVKVGEKVDENTVVCIVEAMKVMNEVKAGVSGTVAEILIENGHPVEFGTKIIRIV